MSYSSHVVRLSVGFLIVICLLSTSWAEQVKHVFIVSFDQTGPAHVEAADMPTYKSMAKEGAHTWEAYTIVPSITLPSHTSMVTGVGIQKHQINWNDTWDEKKRQLHVPTIFELAHAKGLSTAIFSSKQKFILFEKRGGVDHFELVSDSESNVNIGKLAAEYILKEKPNLMFIHFGDPDVKGHTYGAMSKEKMASLATADAALKQIRDAAKEAGILDSSVFILTADHGAHDVIKEDKETKEKKVRGTHGTSEPEDVLIPWIAWGTNTKPGFEITAPVQTYDTAATALWLLGVDVPESFWGRPVISAFNK